MLVRSDRNSSVTKRRATARLVAASAATLAAAVFCVWPMVSAAQAPDLGLNYATAIGLSTTDIRTTIANIIRGFLGLLGVVAVGLILYAGFLWMTAGGDQKKIDDARKILVNAAIGLLIIMAAYAITAFIFRALTGEGGGIFGGGAGGALTSQYCAGCGPENLGSGIISYHYPEVGQTGVARNTKIAVSFKKPLRLATIFRNYDDKGTYDIADDVLCGPDCKTAGHAETAVVAGTQLYLNTDNFKILPNDGLGPVQGGDPDARFNARYPAGAQGLLLEPPPKASVTPVAAQYDPDNNGQTLVIKPAEWLGSAVTDVNYRVAIRGGAGGVGVWDTDAAGTGAQAGLAFWEMKTADGGYYWPFTTGTTVDTTPPKIAVVVPVPKISPQTIDRNQILQIYFDEAVDPTTASGATGSGGFTRVNVEAKPKDSGGAYAAIDGNLTVSNRYRTVEFLSSTPCDGIDKNSCGDTVYCLPANADLKVTAKAATLGAEPPAAIDVPDGVTDMAGNSLDGNGDGIAEGPVAGGLSEYPLNNFWNNAPQGYAGWSDTAVWRYFVGTNIDLVPPKIVAVGPVSPPPSETAYPDGPSKVPPAAPITVTWSKIISPMSLRTGVVAEAAATVILQSREYVNCAKTNCAKPVSGGGGIAYEPLGTPSFFVDTGLFPDAAAPEFTRMSILHRDFKTANDLGWGEDDKFAEGIPVYAPLIRSRVMDDKQNCFYPSAGLDCQINEAAGMVYCCDREARTKDAFQCAP